MLWRMAQRTYGHLCPIACALDVVGDRWNLLILRELSFGAQRFSDLRDTLTGIAPNLLTDRLRDLAAAGLVQQEELPAPAARTVYALTPEGREVRPVLAALARFGAKRLPAPEVGGAFPPSIALRATIIAFHEPAVFLRADDVFRLEIDSKTYDLRRKNGRVFFEQGNDTPDVLITTDAATLLGIRRDDTTFDDAVACGAIIAAGSARAIERFRRAFSL